MKDKISDNKKKTSSEHDLELEILTRKFISGEIKLDDFRKKVKDIELDTRLDLRRMATKLKPILVSIKQRK